MVIIVVEVDDVVRLVSGLLSSSFEQAATEKAIPMITADDTILFIVFSVIKTSPSHEIRRVSITFKNNQIYYTSFFKIINHLFETLSDYIRIEIFIVKQSVCRVISPLTVDCHVFFIRSRVLKTATLDCMNGALVFRHDIRLYSMDFPCVKHIVASA